MRAVAILCLFSAAIGAAWISTGAPVSEERTLQSPYRYWGGNETLEDHCCALNASCGTSLPCFFSDDPCEPEVIGKTLWPDENDLSCQRVDDPVNPDISCIKDAEEIHCGVMYACQVDPDTGDCENVGINYENVVLGPKHCWETAVCF